MILPKSVALAGTFACLASTWAPATARVQEGPPRVVAWNDLGMHCIDPDFSVFSILPPFNTIDAQLVLQGSLVTQPGGIQLTYEALADPTGSINTTSIGKTNFWDYVEALFGVALPPDVGLAGFAMPGAGNVPQTMGFDEAWDWFDAVGVPLTPIDDALAENPYPLVRITARNGQGTVLATTLTTAPNSQELRCNECHASGASPFARPSIGWAFHPDPWKDDRWNILRLHDEKQAGDPAFTAALFTAGYEPTGLVDTVENGTPILCSKCHGSNALPGTGIPGISPMTAAIHGGHADVMNTTGETLDEVTVRRSCYLCHPGLETRCLRGAMGKAIGSDGDFAMSCQSCHGTMSDVGDPLRNGWFDEPDCESCHTGSATSNNGQIRFTSVFEPGGAVRSAVSDLFATTEGVPISGASLYRFSTGHGNLQCAACHGPPHAIYPTSESNDNMQSMLLQGHEGTIVDCTVCHSNLEDDEIQGPHGMHPVTNAWAAGKHSDAAESNLGACLACHGADARGTELSRAQGDRTFSTQLGARDFWRGFQVSCYACHNGPNDESPTPNAAPFVPDRSESTPNDTPLALTLTGSDPNGNPLTFRIISQPAHGTVGLVGSLATYLPEAGYLGADAFTYAAWDGSTNSNLGTVSLEVDAPVCAGSIESYGFPCLGSGDELPRLSVTGCPTPGGTISFHLEDALGGATAWLLGSPTRATAEVTPACVRRIGPIVLRVANLHVPGAGAGAGSLDFDVNIPDGFPASTLAFQMVVRDPGASGGWAGTNGIELDIR